ncbi:hypothetical protein KSP40_PGU003446 [Platanthera guangdongensis]|uniref:RNase H type-1 domain-containing protein n=1 Tax=Platanthera guangdongensis TaxID=2320717 RepID=A0ABR2M7R4_9ASPA
MPRANAGEGQTFDHWQWEATWTWSQEKGRPLIVDNGRLQGRGHGEMVNGRPSNNWRVQKGRPLRLCDLLGEKGRPLIVDSGIPREVGTPVVIAATIAENLAIFDQGRKLGCWGTSRTSGLPGSSSLCPPPPGWIKINVDGSLLPLRCDGLGIVIRSEVGEVLRAGGFGWQHWDPGRDELEVVLAICRVLLPSLFEARVILIEGDVTNILEFCSSVTRRSSHPSPFAPEVAVAVDFLWDLGCGADDTFLGLVAEDYRGLEGG